MTNTMVLTKLFILYFSIICSCHCIGQGLAYCPTHCLCNEELGFWNCSSLTLEDLQQDPSPELEQEKFKVPTSVSEVKHLHFENLKKDFDHNLSELFPNVESVEFVKGFASCTRLSIWLLNWSDKIKDFENIHCSSPRLLNGTSVINALNLLQHLDQQCPKECDCEIIPQLHNFTKIEHLAKKSISVNCSGRNFRELPTHLPANFTISLDLNNNQIENLEGLSTNPIYKHVIQLYLNNNKIKSLSLLENSPWMNYFSLLSVQGNQIEEIPTQVFANAFRQPDFKRLGVLFSNNPFKCDCLTTTNLQKFIAKYTRPFLNDAKKICCGPGEGVNAGKKVVNVDLSSVCVNPNDNMTVMMYHLLNTFFCLMICCVISKLIYDWCIYRKTGRLPWFVSKMP